MTTADLPTTDVELVRRLLTAQFPQWADRGSLGFARPAPITRRTASAPIWSPGCHAPRRSRTIGTSGGYLKVGA